MSTDALDFLDESPVTPNPTVSSAPAPAEPEIPTPLAVDPIAEARATVEAADAAAKLAKHRLKTLEVEQIRNEPEMSLHERNQEAKRIEAELSKAHFDAMEKLRALGVNVAKIVKENTKRAVKKPVPQLFKA
jgi:hypothetical protein